MTRSTKSYNRLQAAIDDHEYRVASRSLKYINEFFSLSCAPTFIASGVLPRGDGGKELTEIMGMYGAVRKHLVNDFGDESITLLDVGCGTSPRGAALFALRTKWQCVAIDPRLKRCPNTGNRNDTTVIERLYDYTGTVDDYLRAQADGDFGDVVVCINTHGHAPLSYLDMIPGDVWSVSMACCHVLTPPDDFEEIDRYTDPCVISPKNEIVVHRRR
jgi:hypothetical protein